MRGGFVSEGRGGFVPRGRGFGGGDRGGRGFGGGRGFSGGGRGSFGGDRGGRGFGGRGGFAPSGPRPTRKSFDDDGDDVKASDDDETEKADNRAGRVIHTTVNEDGSEIPQRLNNKVFIDGLPFNHDPTRHEGKSLDDLLLQFVNDWKVGKMMHLTKKPGQGFGYLAFRSPNSVETAINVLNGRKFLGRPLRVQLPKTAEESGPSPAAIFKGKQQERTQNAERQVLLSDLAKISEPEIIREVLRGVAPHLEDKIENIKMVSGNRKAFVTMRSVEDVDAAVTFLNGFSLLGRTIACNRAQAPGMMPYSRVAPITAQTDETVATKVTPWAVAGIKTKFVDHDDDDEAVPLGVNAVLPQAAAPAAGQAIPEKSFEGPREVYVSNLPDDVTESSLKQHFSKCGVIKSVSLVANGGVAVVTFASATAATFATNTLNHSHLHGSPIQVGTGEEVAKIATTSNGKNITSADEESEEEDIDEEGFLRARGISNPKAYFANLPQSTLAEKKEAKKDRKKRDREAATADSEEVAADVTTKKTRVEDKKAAKPAKKEAKAEVAVAPKKESSKIVSKDVVSFDDDEVFTSKKSTKKVVSKAAEASDSDEEVFADVDAKPLAPKKKYKNSGKK